MKKVSMIDDTFLRIESRRQPLHVGMLMLFESQGERPSEFVTKLANKLRKSTRAAAPFNRRLVTRRGIHYWKGNKDFDLAHHFVHIALPAPGRIRELLAMVSRIHCGHLDRAYPLWRLYLIEGLEDGRFAVYIKIHHSVVDGIAGIRMLINSMSTNKEDSLNIPPPWEIPTRRSAAKNLPAPSPAGGGLYAIRSITRGGIKSVRPVLREFRSNVMDLWHGNPDFVTGGQAPRCVFNQKISATRRFAAQSYSTARIRAIAKAYGATLNDVTLALCAGALRHYLQDLQQLPSKPLIAAVPVSVRRENTELGNEVTFTFTHLASHIENPVERLLAIKSCMDYNKATLKRLSPEQSLVCAAIKLVPTALNSLTGNSKNFTLANLVISHMPGPRKDMYWQGAKLCGLYPASVLLDGNALNITLVSRHDYVDFGLIACRKSVPSMQRLLGYIEDSLVELESSISDRELTVPRTDQKRSMEQSYKLVSSAVKAKEV